MAISAGLQIMPLIVVTSSFIYIFPMHCCGDKTCLPSDIKLPPRKSFGGHGKKIPEAVTDD
jgi:hypothetical protein